MANWEAARRKTDLFGCNHRNRMAREIGSGVRYFSLSDCLVQLFCSWRFDRFVRDADARIKLNFEICS